MPTYFSKELSAQIKDPTIRQEEIEKRQSPERYDRINDFDKIKCNLGKTKVKYT